MSKLTIDKIRKLKGGDPFAALTAYDFSSARLVDRAGIPVILVGDSAAMVMLGYDTTIPVTVEELVILTRAVARGTENALVVADMPFMSYQQSVETALTTAGRFIKDGMAGAVKLEGGVNMTAQISAIVDCGIPVMGHVGLTPQSFHQMSGYRVQGKKSDDAEQIIRDAHSVEDAGAFSIVLEGVPAELAKIITVELSIPTIGIGAGPFCDGQIQVFHDILGLTDFVPRHAKEYDQIGSKIQGAVTNYRLDVESQRFPETSNYTKLKSDVLGQLSHRKDADNSND